MYSYAQRPRVSLRNNHPKKEAMSDTSMRDYTDFPDGQAHDPNPPFRIMRHIKMPGIGHTILDQDWAKVDQAIGDGSCLDGPAMIFLTPDRFDFRFGALRQVKREVVTRFLVLAYAHASRATPCERTIGAATTGATPAQFAEMITFFPKVRRHVIDAVDPFEPLEDEGSQSVAEKHLLEARCAGFSPSDRAESVHPCNSATVYLLVDSRPSPRW